MLLLDTQAFLYFVLDSQALSRRALAAIVDSRNQVLLSVASVWEMAIKVSIGKLTFTHPFGDFLARQIRENDLSLLPVTFEHAATVASLPLHHRDPFDRMLVAQSLTDRLPLVSGDGAFDSYGVERIW